MLLMLLAGLAGGVWLSHKSSSASNAPPEDDPRKGGMIDTALPVASDDPSQRNTTPHPNQSGAAQDQGPMEHPDGHQMEEVIQAILAQNLPSEFHGKVVDQDNNPVSGSIVLLKLREGFRIRLDM